MNLPQDNQPLRGSISMTLIAYGLSTVSQRAEDNCIDALVALFQAEQTRLKAELIAKLRDSLLDKSVALKNEDTAVLWDDISAALDTLERGA